MIRRDPIVEEVRKHREAIAREHGNNVAAIVEALEREDASDDGTPLVSFPPKRSPRRAGHRPARATRRPNNALEPSARD